MYEIKHDEIFKDEALKFIKNNPLQVVNLSIKKFIFFGFIFMISVLTILEIIILCIMDLGYY